MSRLSMLILLMLAACATDRQDSLRVHWSQGTQWTLLEINASAIDLPDTASLNFDEKDRSISGFTGCNRLFGSYTHQGDRFAISKLGMSKRFCTGAQGELEQRLVKQLQTADRIRILDGQLLISGPFGILTLAPEDPDAI